MKKRFHVEIHTPRTSKSWAIPASHERVAVNEAMHFIAITETGKSSRQVVSKGESLMIYLERLD